MVSTSNSPNFVGFVDHDYHYKSVTTEIPHDVGLELICLAGDRTQDHCVRDSDFATAADWVLKYYGV